MVVENKRQPPAERPALRQGTRQPRAPHSHLRGYGREVDVPDVVRPFGGDNSTGIHAGPFRLPLTPALSPKGRGGFRFGGSVRIRPIVVAPRCSAARAIS